MEALDTWQDTTPALTCLAGKGVRAIGRYYSKNAWKRLGRSEAEALSKAGFTIWVVYQNANNSYAVFSRDRGILHARAALDYAVATIDQPEGSAIYFAVDYDASPAEAAGKISAYFQGVADTFAGSTRNYSVGVYGNGAVCAHLLDAGLVDHCWLTMSTGHHGHREFYESGRWALCQKLEDRLCGMDVDPDEINPARDFGGFTLGVKTLAASLAPLVGDENPDRAFLKADGVNFRDAPDGKVIRTLDLGDEAALLADGADPAWRHVRIGGSDGYVAARYLRPPQNKAVEDLLRNVRDEWLRFDKGRGSEKSDPYCQYVGEMWRALDLNFDGRSTYSDGKDVPWSAAFISWVVRRSGNPYRAFAFADQHSVFVNDAIQARLLNRLDRPFWGYRIGEQRPALGDIVARNRAGNGYSFDYAETHSDYESHSDVVVEIRDQTIRVIGGNVGNTVSVSSTDASGDNSQEYALDPAGLIAPGQKVIALLKNRAAEV